MLRFIALAAISLLLIVSCKDKNCPNNLKYQIPYTAAPIQDTFQIADTILIEMNFSDQLTDLNGSVENTFRNFDFKIQLQCDRFDIDPPQGKAVSFMDVFPTVGEVIPRGLPSSGISYFEVLPIYEAEHYRFKAAVVLKQQGTFWFAISPYTDEMLAPFEIKGNCDHIPLHFTNKVNDGDPTANNYHLLKSSPVDAYRNITLERFGVGGFCFVVR